jgi:alkanesulfonate monooxygenase SsuD/methylene tetrahydromethanopterin reductase-like flavin-dependent oxidoreductase (luciferase family)
MAATTQDTFPQVGAQGYPIFVGLRGTDQHQTGAFLQVYRDAWRKAGHPGDGDVYIRIPVYVAATAERAYEEPREGTILSYRRQAQSFARSAGRAGTTASEDRAERAARLESTGYNELLANRLAYGTPDAVARRLVEMRDDLKLSGFVLEPNAGGAIPTPQVFESVRLFSDEVAPALR